MEQQNTPVPPSDGDAGQIAVNPAVRANVSDVLRATRLRLGIDLGAVATTLHIRVSYLEAIEDGNYDALPGGTYAVGFIRSYGEQLGLDGVELVRRFKQETGASVPVKPEPASFPAPVRGAGLPLGAIATGIAVAGGLAFAGWYLISGNESASTLLPKIPAALNEKISSPPAAPAPMEPSAPPPAAVPAPVAAAPAPEPAAPAPTVAPSAPAPAPAKPEPAKPEPAKPAPVASAPAVPAPSPAPAPAKPEPVKPEAQPQAPAAPAKPVVPPPPPRPVVDENPDSPPATPEPLNRQARVYGEENAGARIELVATADAWVQVTENGSLVLTRLMHAGDRFLVPNRPGLTLMTGNAGGLQIVVDGQKGPALGSQGQVVRDVSLSAERLRGGR